MLPVMSETQAVRTQSAIGNDTYVIAAGLLGQMSKLVSWNERMTCVNKSRELRLLWGT